MVTVEHGTVLAHSRKSRPCCALLLGSILVCTRPLRAGVHTAMSCVCVSTAALQGLSPDADVNNEDNDVVAKGMETLQQALDATAKLGGKYMVGVIFSALHKYPGPQSAAARRNVVASMQVRFAASLCGLLLSATWCRSGAAGM